MDHLGMDSSRVRAAWNLRGLSAGSRRAKFVIGFLKRSILLSLIGFTMTIVMAREALAQSFTIQEVVRIALARNERARIANLNVETAESAVVRARAGFLPTVTVGATDTMRPYSPDTQKLRTNAMNASLTVNQPLFSTSAYLTHSSANHSLDAARYNQLDARRLLCFDAARSFFSVIAQQRLLKAAQRRLERSNNTLADTHARVQAQLVSSNDETRAMVERATSLQTLAGATSALQQARVNLEFILDSQVPEEVEPPSERLVPPTFQPELLAGQAAGQRPDLASARETASAASINADEPGLRMIPTLSAQGRATLNDQPVAGSKSQNWDATVAVVLSWQIWDAGLRGADTQSRRATADTADLQVRALQRKIQADVRVAIAALTAARSSLEAAESGVLAATRSAEETSVLYRQGLAKAIELFNANQSRFDAEVSLAAAQLNLRQAELDLRAALGLFPVDGVK